MDFVSLPLDNVGKGEISLVASAWAITAAPDALSVCNVCSSVTILHLALSLVHFLLEKTGSCFALFFP